MPLTKTTARSRAAGAIHLTSASGLTLRFGASGAVQRIEFGPTHINLFPGNDLEGGVANLYLRWQAPRRAPLALLGPTSPLRFAEAEGALVGRGRVGDLALALTCVPAPQSAAWFWHLTIDNAGSDNAVVDLVCVQDLALARYDSLRLNEHYVSHYLDHTPLAHPRCGWVIATRQNLADGGRNPWFLLGSLRRAIEFATDGLQFDGMARRAGAPACGLVESLPSRRLQHEHALAALQDAPLHIAPGECAQAGFFAWVQADHPTSTTSADLAVVDRVLALAEARPPVRSSLPGAKPVRPCLSSPTGAASLFAPVRLLPARDLTDAEIDAEFDRDRCELELDEEGGPLSFFTGTNRHVVLREKELRVLRPHGHILRTGGCLAPDETSLTSTVWMSGLFHSMLTQGHVSLNRLLSGARGYLAQFRARGLRIFVKRGGDWLLLDLPSAFEMSPDGCRWLYRHDAGTIDVRSAATTGGEMSLQVALTGGEPACLLLCLHVAVDGDDGDRAQPVRFRQEKSDLVVEPAAQSELARTFPGGHLRIRLYDTPIAHIADDAVLFADGRSRGLPYVCVVTAPVCAARLSLCAELIAAQPHPWPQPLALPRLVPPPVLPVEAVRLARILPWFAHNALIHWLAPRGLEQFSGGGWGTRDVCQGPVELLLAVGHLAAVRATLCRVFAAQNADGDWPQWFTFFDRHRQIRAGDSHGDIVFWPLLALAEYLLDSGDGALLDQPLPFHAEEGGAVAPIWQHVERALAVIASRRIVGTDLVAYGHGDWNDALQPAEPALRDRLCSAWTVTLHAQTFTALAAALRSVGRAASAQPLETEAKAVRAAFSRHLLVDGVIAGYALFDDHGRAEYLLHPRDRHTGVRFSLLPMIHAIINDLIEPEQAREHLRLIERHLHGPDGARLFDRPLPYHGGPQRFFQRAESSSYFGREIGLMYMHAHLRYAEALAHMGEARAFFDALAKAHPIGLADRVPSAALRQSNCYYSSSDALFADRATASAEYERVASGRVTLEGGWRVYSSGPGIFVGLVLRRLLGVRRRSDALLLDPVMPASLDGLRATLEIGSRTVEIEYRVGARGHGVGALTLNGAALPFERAAHYCRQGGAVVAIEELSARLTEPVNRLRVALG